MGPIQVLNSFKFNKNRVVNYKISLELTDILTTKVNWHRKLPLNCYTALRKRKIHAIVINRLQKPMTDFVVHIIVNTQNLFGQFSMQKFRDLFFH